jgi:hypothetical protein
MRDFSSLDSMEKFSGSLLSNTSQSGIFPGMVKIPYTEHQSQKKQKASFIKNKNHKTPFLEKPQENQLPQSDLLPIGVAGVIGFTLGKTFGKIIERPIDNLPAGLIGASVCGLAMLGASGFCIAKYGGFFDKDRDYRKILKNL